MVITLPKSSEPHQEKKSTPKTDPISPKQPTDQRDIHVAVDYDYLPVLGKKILNHYTKKNKTRQQDGSIHIFEITNCLRQSLILQQHPEEIARS